MKKRFLTWLARRLRPYTATAVGAPPTQFIRVAYHTPRQVVLLTARHGLLENVWPIDWHMPVSITPQMYAISLTASSFGTELVRDSGLFVVNFVPDTWEKIIFYCGQTSGRAVDKFAASHLRKAEATAVNAPYLADALGRLECRVTQSWPIGDRLLFVADVAHADVAHADVAHADVGHTDGAQDAAQLYHLDGRLQGAEAQFGHVRR